MRAFGRGMDRLARTLQPLLRGALAVALFLAVLVLLAVAWWIALLAIAGWLAYAGVRRLLRGRPPARPAGEAPIVIEGEYRVETNDSLPDARTRR